LVLCLVFICVEVFLSLAEFKHEIWQITITKHRWSDIHKNAIHWDVRICFSLEFVCTCVAEAMSNHKPSSNLYGSEELFPSPCPISNQTLSQILPFWLIFQLHVIRRALESLYIHKFSERASVSLINIFLAPSFYLFANISPIVELLYKPNFTQNGLDVTGTLGLLLFCYASYQQHYCHKILARLRVGPKESRYFVPYGGLFEQVSCPHYFAEILIYLAFLLVLGDLTNTSMWLIWAFVIANLSTSGIETHRWYKQQFGDSYPKYRRAIFPFVL